MVKDPAGDWRQLDERIEAVTDEIETLAKSDDSCRRVMTVPGIGPIISSAMVAAIGSGAAFARGRDFRLGSASSLKQMSTGDRTILGRISKRGNGCLRTLFMQAARVILLRAAWSQGGAGGGSAGGAVGASTVGPARLNQGTAGDGPSPVASYLLLLSRAISN
jgi:transposase